jgi:hypothetical protein
MRPAQPAVSPSLSPGSLVRGLFEHEFHQSTVEGKRESKGKKSKGEGGTAKHETITDASSMIYLCLTYEATTCARERERRGQ